MPGTVPAPGDEDITKIQPWKQEEERQTGGGKCDKETGNFVRMHWIPGSDSNNEKTQKNMKIVMKNNFIVSD